MAPTMRPLFARILAPLGLAAILAMPLSAQLDPRLQKDPTDFLDLYQKSNSLTIKPEIVSVLDFSGSMNALMWHPSYFADTAESHHLPSGYAGGDNTWVRPYVVSMSSTSGPSINFATYTNGDSGYKSSPFKTNGILIKSDGTPVTSADVAAQPGSLGKTGYAINWIRLATHVRITMTDPTTSAKRQLDLPIPYTIFDSPSSISTTSSSYSTSSAPDPQNSNVATPFDTAATDASSNIYSSSDVTGYFYLGCPGKGWIGHFWYTRDYLFWLFFGKDVPNSSTNPTGWTATSNYVVPDSTTSSGQAFNNGIPALTRYQGVKRAVISAWLANQTSVYWAYRFLDYQDEETLDTVDPSNTNAPNPASSSNTRALQLFSKATGGSVDPSVQALASALPYAGTPLTYAYANVLAQLNVDKNSVFDGPHTADKYTSPSCQTMFVVLFTDGMANDGYTNGGDGSALGGGNPYNPSSIPAGSSNANEGNKKVIANGLDSLNPSQVNFNTWTLAGVAAHGADSSLASVIPVPSTYPTGSAQEPQYFAPFFVQERGNGTSYAATFTPPRPIQTMTVGVSLPGSYLDSTSAKFALLATAADGDPNNTTWNLSSVVPYDPTSAQKTYFFDARDPNVLADNIASAISNIIQIANGTTASAPTVPFVGLGLASEIYLGTFIPPTNVSPVWPGDLMMFPTKQVNGATVIIDNTGVTATKLTSKQAVWTASSALAARPWYQRKVFTRLPATSTTPQPSLLPLAFDPPTGYPATTVASATGFNAIKAFVATSTSDTDAQKSQLIEFVLGADTTSTASILPNRTSIMGDIVDSAPAAVEYTLTDALKTELAGVSTTLSNALSNAGARFRVIFVGTNQGMLHAFGEVSWTDTTTNPSQPFTTGVVDELWAFVPTDFLANLDYLVSNQSHRFMVDGSPYVYFLDLAPSGQTVGNGTVDSTETARVIFGLGKGGRSYYALDIHDPCNPAMAWALSPDEVTATPAILDNGPIEASNAAVAKTAVENMGFSSSNLAVGRVEYGSPVVHLRDALFLGGGFSTPAIDTAFGTSLGRSALAVDAANGHILMAWDFLKDPNLSGTATGMGPVGAGVVPFEYFLNSGLVQRAYFTDFNGSLWALGSGANTLASDAKYYRRDTSSLDAWTVDGQVGSSLTLRKVYTGNAQDVSTTLPAPFLTGNVAPAAGTIPVGIAFSTGNRDNPLDFLYTSKNPAPTQHETMVVFDSQELSQGGTPITFSDLYQVPNTAATSTTPPEVTPGDTKYYLANSKRGYEIAFPTPTGGFIPKGINPPLVLGGAMFFSYFNPTSSDPCKGGAGSTYANRICDVVSPLYQGNTTTVTNSYTGPCVGGNVFAWSGVATNFSARSTVSVNQAGLVSTTVGGSSALTTQIQTIFGNVRDRMPRPRVWRVVR